MLVLLDNGHGGLINGVYQTPGKRSPVWSNDTQVFEGEFNRAIVNGVIEQLTSLKIPYVNIAPEYEDTSLAERVKRANRYAGSDCFLVSVHSNAGGGAGCEVFTSKGQTKSDAIATIFVQKYRQVFPNEVLRTDYSDGDPDKESDFYMLTKTKMPAILTENFFMDNERECREFLLSREGRQKIIDYHVQAILEVKKKLF